jgi:hypothetical protein
MYAPTAYYDILITKEERKRRYSFFNDLVSRIYPIYKIQELKKVPMANDLLYEFPRESEYLRFEKQVDAGIPSKLYKIILPEIEQLPIIFQQYKRLLDKLNNLDPVKWDRNAIINFISKQASYIYRVGQKGGFL